VNFEVHLKEEDVVAGAAGPDVVDHPAHQGPGQHLQVLALPTTWRYM